MGGELPAVKLRQHPVPPFFNFIIFLRFTLIIFKAELEGGREREEGGFHPLVYSPGGFKGQDWEVEQPGCGMAPRWDPGMCTMRIYLLGCWARPKRNGVLFLLKATIKKRG